MLPDLIQNAVRPFRATMIREIRSCAYQSMASAIFAVMAGHSPFAKRFDQHRVRHWVPNYRPDLLQPWQLAKANMGLVGVLGQS
jgi:hypothetical protein